MKQIPRLLAVTAIAAAVACSDSFKPTVDNVSGIYLVQSFTTDSAGTSKDWIAAGATLELLLSPGGEVGGQLIMPGVPSDTATFIALMNGTWTLTGKTVHLSQIADTFVRDMDWIASENRLSGDATFGAVHMTVVLKKALNQ